MMLRNRTTSKKFRRVMKEAAMFARKVKFKFEFEFKTFSTFHTQHVVSYVITWHNFIFMCYI
jgi:hypothetical protein